MRVTDLLAQFDVKTVSAGEHHHAHEGWIQMDCPWCGRGSGGMHLGYSLSGGHMNCWRCGRHSFLDFLVEVSGLPRSKCLGLLKGLAPEGLTAPINKRGTLKLPKGLVPMGKRHRRYLEQERGLDADEMERLWDLRGLGVGSKLGWRIFIPIYFQGRMVSWTTRALNDKGLRYVAARPEEEELNAKHLLFGEDYCRGSIVVFEGHLDVMAYGPGSAATGGLAITEAQVARIAKYPTRVICFDKERIAQRKAASLCDALAPMAGRTILAELSRKDASEADAAELEELRALAGQTNRKGILC